MARLDKQQDLSNGASTTLKHKTCQKYLWWPQLDERQGQKLHLQFKILFNPSSTAHNKELPTHDSSLAT